MDVLGQVAVLHQADIRCALASSEGQRQVGVDICGSVVHDLHLDVGVLRLEVGQDTAGFNGIPYGRRPAPDHDIARRFGGLRLEGGCHYHLDLFGDLDLHFLGDDLFFLHHHRLLDHLLHDLRRGGTGGHKAGQYDHSD